MGKIFKFDQDVDTDQIIASQYLLFPTIDEMKTHTFESLDPDFAANVNPGDYVVASENFGCGSSREQAPSVLKALGVKAVVAKSFARIFYRRTRGMISCTGRTSKQAISIQCGMCMMVVRSFEIILRTSSAACAGIVIFVFNVIFTIY